LKQNRRIFAVAASLLIVLVSLPKPVFAANSTPTKITITNINIHRGATMNRDLIGINVLIDSPTTITNWSLQLLSNRGAFTSRSELAVFANSTIAVGDRLVSKTGDSPLIAQTPFAASMSLTGKPAMVRELGVHGFWLQLTTNGAVAKSLPFFAYGSGGSEVQPTPITWALPLVEPPHRDLVGNFNDDDLAKTLAPDGRLGRILNFGGGPLVTWIIDPELVESAAAMARGYTFAHGKPGTGQQIATAWLAQLRGVVANSDVLALPYGDPDLITLAQGGLKKDLLKLNTEGVIRLSALLQRPVTRIAGWSNAGRLNKSTKSLIENGAVTTILLSSDSFHFLQTATNSSNLSPRAAKSQLLYDSTLANQLIELTPLSANRLAAELTMITAERPSIARAQLLLPPRLWNPNNESMQSVKSGVPVNEISLEKLQSSPVTSKEPVRLSKVSPLDEGELEALQMISKNLRTFASTNQIGDQTSRNEMLRSALVLSTSWRGRGFNASLYAQRAETDSDHIVRQVRVVSGRYTLTTLHQKLPITIANDSNGRATVTLRFTPTTYRVLQPQSVNITLEAKSKTQVMVPIDAITSGNLILDAEVLTPRGEILGDVAQLSLSIRTVPSIANWIMEGAAIALVLGAGAQIIRRLRRRKNLEPDTLQMKLTPP